MDAALACLFEYGYSGTTMAQVSDRAGVSRGAPHHHYGSKSELMAAAVKHLTEAMISAFDLELAAASDGASRIDAFLNGIWRTLEGPLFASSLELVVAARTDPSLAEVLQRNWIVLSNVIDSHVDEVARATHPGDPVALADALHLSVHLVHAFALDGVPRDRTARNRRLYEQWCQYVRAVANRTSPVVKAS